MQTAWKYMNELEKSPSIQYCLLSYCIANIDLTECLTTLKKLKIPLKSISTLYTINLKQYSYWKNTRPKYEVWFFV